MSLKAVEPTCSKDLFMSFILARSLSQADLLYCSLLPSSSNLLVLFSFVYFVFFFCVFVFLLIALEPVCPCLRLLVLLEPPGRDPLDQDVHCFLRCWSRGGWRVEDWVGDVNCWTSILHLKVEFKNLLSQLGSELTSVVRGILTL